MNAAPVMTNVVINTTAMPDVPSVRRADRTHHTR